MTDEMKLKHGVLWNSQTGKAVGLANDMLDLNAMMKRVLSDDGDVVKPAVYVNCWRYTAIRADKTEGWMCGFFFNDGSLTGDTLLRQFDHVTLCCESIGSHVYGLVLDAGGNNAKFARRLHNDVTFADEVSWIDEEFCYTRNIYDPTRRIEQTPMMRSIYFKRLFLSMMCRQEALIPIMTSTIHPSSNIPIPEGSILSP